LNNFGGLLDPVVKQVEGILNGLSSSGVKWFEAGLAPVQKWSKTSGTSA
jgi:hypothetical protein